MPLLFETQDEHGSIRVFDDGKFRLLSFADGDEQSRIQLKAPHVLQHEYTQAMLLALIHKHPKRVCILGLGGGALIHALMKAVAGINITAVELRQDIVDVAKEYFHLPQSKRLDIITEDAVDYLANTNDKKVDILFTDLYQHFGMDNRVTTESFLLDAKARLKADGMLVLNCWDEHQYDDDLKDILINQFSHVQALDTGCGNWVVFATNTPHGLNGKQQKEECEKLSLRLGYSLYKWQSRLQQVV